MDIGDRLRQWWRRDSAYAIGRIYEMSREDVDRLIGRRIEDPARTYSLVHAVGWQRFR